MHKSSVLLTTFFYVLVAGFSLGQLGRITLYEGEVHIYAHEILIGIFCLIAMTVLVMRKQFVLIKNAVFKWWVLFILWLCVSLIFYLNSYSLLENIIGLMYILRLMLYTLFAVILFLLVNNIVIQPKVVRNGLYLFFGITLTTSILQYVWYPDLRNLYYLGWDPHWYRVFGLFFDTSITAIVLGSILIFSLDNLLFIKDHKQRYVWMVILVVSLGLFLLTYSRIGYIALSISLSIFFLRLRKYLIVVLFFIVGFVFVLILPRPQGESVKLERVFTIESRITDVKRGVELWKKRMLTGVGYNRIRFHKEYVKNSNSASGFSSTYITILASSGLIGLLFLMLSLIQFGLFLWKNKIAFSMFLLVCVGGVFDNILFQTHILCITVLYGIFYNSLLFSHTKSNPRG